MWWPGYTILVNEEGWIRCYGGEQNEPYVVIEPGDDDTWPIIDWMMNIVRECAIIEDADHLSSTSASSGEESE